MKSVLGSVLALIWFSSYPSCAAENGEIIKHLEDAASRETDALRACELKNACPVYFARALGGYFPIPMRYHLITGADNMSQRLSFASPVSMSLKRFLFTDSGVGTMGDKVLTGTISIGKTQDIMDAQEAGTIALSVTKKVGLITVAKMLSPVNPALTAGPFGRGVTVLYTDKDYVQISDSNRDLVDALLRIYFYVNSSPD